MAKYINADDMNDILMGVANDIQSKMTPQADLIKMIAAKLSLMPSADVRENKHGKWIRTNPLTDTLECSLCGMQVPIIDLCSPYCPLCGADMRGENE